MLCSVSRTNVFFLFLVFFLQFCKLKIYAVTFGYAVATFFLERAANSAYHMFFYLFSFLVV